MDEEDRGSEGDEMFEERSPDLREVWVVIVEPPVEVGREVGEGQ